MVSREAIRQRWEVFGSKLEERGKRLFAAAEARTAGHGGVAAVAQITGLARSTIGRGLNDLDTSGPGHGRVRRKGGGRREVADLDATLVSDLQRLAEPATMGDPRDRQPFERLVQCLIVAKADSIGLLVRMLCQCWAGKSKNAMSSSRSF